MHVSKQVQALGQLVSRLHYVGLLDHVRPQVNLLVGERLADLSDFGVLPLGRVHVCVEEPPG